MFGCCRIAQARVKGGQQVWWANQTFLRFAANRVGRTMHMSPTNVSACQYSRKHISPMISTALRILVVYLAGITSGSPFL